MKFEEGYLMRKDPSVIEARWCIDSETSQEVLINLLTSEIIAFRIAGRIVDPHEVPPNADSQNLR